MFPAYSLVFEKVAKFEKVGNQSGNCKATPLPGNLNNTQSIGGGRVTNLFEVTFFPTDLF